MILPDGYLNFKISKNWLLNVLTNTYKQQKLSAKFYKYGYWSLTGQFTAIRGFSWSFWSKRSPPPTISWNFMMIFTFIQCNVFHSCHIIWITCVKVVTKKSWTCDYVKYYFSSLDVIFTFLLQRTGAIIELLMTTLRRVLKIVILCYQLIPPSNLNSKYETRSNI